MSGRPPIYTDDTVVAVVAKNPRSKLQDNSERRAIINLLINNKGKLTLKEINAHFGFDMRASVTALVRARWLEVLE